MKALKKIPKHLRRYLIAQDYARYTPEDHAVWRFIMRELTTFLYANAHPSYKEGIKKTGITLNKIPTLKHIDRCLRKLGWRAAGVSGFIPPAAFMELQAHGILPIATEMRRIENLDYTPAPDIVHEAAGHAPMLANKQFSRYLRRYAEIAEKAIITKKDMEQYEAIRDLSDLKEHPNATKEQIDAAYKRLQAANAALTETTEAMMLARMGWWTTEYGLMGEDKKIYGAGLLSSVGESRYCLSDKVKKIPFSIECVNYSYDITDPQPQLFVAKDFADLERGLDALADRMAFKRGGIFGLKRMQEAETVNTIELSSGLQISGVLKSWREKNGEPIYVQLVGPTQLCYKRKQLPGHHKKYHAQGYGTPVGPIKQIVKLDKKRVRYEFESGVVVEGVLTKTLKKGGKPILLTFKKCTVTHGKDILFQPEWGNFDMGLGEKVVSVFGGPADRVAYGITDDFVAKKIPPRKFTKEEKRLHALYDLVNKWMDGRKYTEKELLKVRAEVEAKFPNAWLIRFELYELAKRKKIHSDWVNSVREEVLQITEKTPDLQPFVRSSLAIVEGH